MKNNRVKTTRGISIVFGALLVFATIIGIEEKTYVKPMEQRMETELKNSYRLLSSGEDYRKVEQRLTEVAEDIGMEDIHITIGGKHTYGQHNTLTIDGHIQTETLGRRIINRTKVPFKAKLEVPTLKYNET